MSKTVWAEVMASHSGIGLTWGPTNVDRYLLDPKRIAFFMSRYKFAARMLERCRSIVDIGCGDGMGTLTFLSDTKAQSIVGMDFESQCINHAVEHLLPAVARARPGDAGRLDFMLSDFLEDRPVSIFEGAACLDMIEHIEPERGDEFIAQMAETLSSDGVAVVGTPNIAVAQYGSRHSQIGHINMYSGATLRAALERHFRRVFMFSMNDEVVHTGFAPLAHYILALAVK